MIFITKANQGSHGKDWPQKGDNITPLSKTFLEHEETIHAGINIGPPRPIYKSNDQKTSLNSYYEYGIGYGEKQTLPTKTRGQRS